jgi:hypothetical protein
MNPDKDKTFLFMKKLIKNNYHLDKFERIEENKFVENTDELSSIGLEIFENFNTDSISRKIRLFADVCSAPGVYSEIALEKFPDAQGIGITLPPSEGGVEFEIESDRFKKVYKNILDKKYRLEIPKKLDFGMGSCVSYQQMDKNAYYLNIELIIKSLYLLLPNLDKGGHLIINLTIKNIFFAFNIINFLMKNFKSFKLWKSENIWGTKNTFYFFGYDFNGDKHIDEDINKIYDKIKNPKDDIFHKYNGTDEEYHIINNQMRKVYQTRINVWKKLIENQK